MRRYIKVVLGHFETANSNLKGDLLKEHSNLEKDGLCSPVWNLLLQFLGKDILFNGCVLSNVVRYAGEFDAGGKITDGIPQEGLDLMDRLTVVSLNALGAEPDVVTAFGVPVSPDSCVFSPSARRRVNPSLNAPADTQPAAPLSLRSLLAAAVSAYTLSPVAHSCALRSPLLSL